MRTSIFHRDSTLRLICRTGNYLLWCGSKGLLSRKDDQYRINDIWQLSNGQVVTITNRQVDLPYWFELHPLEVSDSLVYWMQKKLNNGYNPREVIEGPNIWRVLVGDRLAWVGKERQGVESDNGVFSVITFDANAVVIGEPLSIIDGLPQFGGFDQQNQSKEDILLCRKGWLAVSKLGMPRSLSAEGKWTIG